MGDKTIQDVASTLSIKIVEQKNEMDRIGQRLQQGIRDFKPEVDLTPFLRSIRETGKSTENASILPALDNIKSILFDMRDMRRAPDGSKSEVDLRPLQRSVQDCRDELLQAVNESKSEKSFSDASLQTVQKWVQECKSEMISALRQNLSDMRSSGRDALDSYTVQGYIQKSQGEVLQGVHEKLAPLLQQQRAFEEGSMMFKIDKLTKIETLSQDSRDAIYALDRKVGTRIGSKSSGTDNLGYRPSADVRTHSGVEPKGPSQDLSAEKRGNGEVRAAVRALGAAHSLG